MEDLRRYFVSESTAKLKRLSADLQMTNRISGSQRNEIFRLLHTLKGSSQTFGFASASSLAHKLENLIAAENQPLISPEKAGILLLEGVQLLKESLREDDFQIPDSFVEKINQIIPDSNDLKSDSAVEIPADLAARLSNREKTALVSALKNGKNLFSLEAEFEPANLAVEFKKLREILTENGEIIAALPGAKSENSTKIGFRFVFVSSLSKNDAKKIAESAAARLVSDYSEAAFPDDLAGVLARIAAEGKKIGEKIGKRIEIAVSSDDIKVSPDKLNLIFEILVHLIRNAADHGIKREGAIKISAAAEDDFLKLSIADDGRGVDAAKVKAEAAAKHFVSADGNLTARETLELIFLPEISTAAEVSEISGRGVGLDAVKTAVEKAGGKITVESSMGKGTTFEILLPNEK